MQIALYPVDHIGLTTYYSASHKGIDLGWRKNPAPDIYSIADGEVVATGVGTDGGLYVFIRHQNIVGLENKTVYSRYYHLKSFAVKAGDKVKRYGKIGVMGTTGNSTGVHLHLDLSVYPLGHSSFPSDFRAHAVNPQDYLYRTENQTVSEDSVGVKLYADAPTKNKEEQSREIKTDYFDLVNEPLYVSSDAKSPAGYVTGRYYPYDNLEFSGRIRITNSLANVGVKNGVTGYINKPTNAVKQKTYTVKKGDSLWRIAKANGVTLDNLIKANPQIKNLNLIYPNQVINIP